MNKVFGFFLLCLVNSSLYAQEVLTDLISNPVLLSQRFEQSTSKLSLTLPFIDDFSSGYSIVSDELWEKSSVFVNQTYGINPPTVGIATFDGLDERGLARDFSPSSSSEPSDTLLSKAIDLSMISSAYFLFYVQAQGMGDAPESQDKLMLEFLNDTAGWEIIWISDDTVLQEFVKVVELIDKPRFLHDNFQFRFTNYATISGNFDHWHIDYIKLDELLSFSDTSELNDVSFVYNSPSFLRRYSEMPWSHFLNYEASELKDSIGIILRNNDAAINVDYQYNVFENGNQIFHYPLLGVSRNVTVLDYSLIGNFLFTDPPINIQSNVFNSFQQDSATFLVQNIIGTSASDNKLNDTLLHFQRFHSHFAYDDGVAESAYGMNINGAQLAYEFKLNRPDTLRAVQMYFPQMLDSVTDIPFRLTIWDNLSGSGNIIYQQQVYPVHSEDGAYHTYFIDDPFKIVGTFYVGWEQTTNDLLNIGFDKNNIANSYMFYNIGSGWNMSSYPGSWMIRPVLSMHPIISGINDIRSDFIIYPNPATSYCFIKTFELSNTISIYSLDGVLLKEILNPSYLTRVDLENFSSGMYIVEVLHGDIKSHQKMILR